MTADVHVTIGEIRITGLGRSEARAAVDALQRDLQAAVGAALASPPGTAGPLPARTQCGNDLGRAAAAAVAHAVATRVPRGGR